MTKALGKEGSFAEGRPIALGKDSLENSGTFLCRGPWRPSAKTFLKKIKISLPRACGEALGKDFLKKKNNSLPRAVPLPSAKIFWKNSATFLCRGPWLEALGKDFSKKKNNSLSRAPGDGPWQRLRPRRRRRDDCFSLPSAAPALGKGFAECPIKGPRQRPSSPTQNSPRALCRGPPSAKPLPRVNGPLPRADKEAVSRSD